MGWGGGSPLYFSRTLNSLNVRMSTVCVPDLIFYFVVRSICLGWGGGSQLYYLKSGISESESGSEGRIELMMSIWIWRHPWHFPKRMVLKFPTKNVSRQDKGWRLKMLGGPCCSRLKRKSWEGPDFTTTFASRMVYYLFVGSNAIQLCCDEGLGCSYLGWFWTKN